MARGKGEILPTEHVFVAGRTGSGKTYLERVYLAGFPFVVMLDTKGTMEWPEVPPERLALVTRLADLAGAAADPQKTHIIYRPNWDEMTDDFYDAFFKWCYMRRNCVVGVDEVMSICPTPSRIPDYYKAILTRGRELGVSVWSLTQRPKTIPLVIMSEASHFFVFDLNMEADRERLVEITGQETMWTRPGKYQFWYYHVEGEQATLAKLAAPK